MLKASCTAHGSCIQQLCDKTLLHGANTALTAAGAVPNLSADFGFARTGLASLTFLGILMLLECL